MRRDNAWGYRNPTVVVFGSGRLRELGAHVSGRALIVTSPGATRRGLTRQVVELAGPTAIVFDRVEPNPAVDAVEAAIVELQSARIETVVGVGGGSALDFAKALSLSLAPGAVTLREALEGGAAEHVEPLRVVAVPTTAGSGSEVTPFATLWDRAAKRKLSLTTKRLFPAVAVLDPDVTLSLPWPATLASGLDAYAQCFESVWNLNATPVTTALAVRGLAAAPTALRALKTDLQSRDARARMLETSLLSGLAISGTRTALSHSISYPITAHYNVPHGLACAITLPAVLAYNLEADDGRIAEAARAAGISDPSRWVQSVIDFLKEIGTPAAFREYVPDFAALFALAPEMLTPGRAGNNLRPADRQEVCAILERTQDWLFGGRRG